MARCPISPDQHCNSTGRGRKVVSQWPVLADLATAGTWHPPVWPQSQLHTITLSTLTHCLILKGKKSQLFSVIRPGLAVQATALWAVWAEQWTGWVGSPGHQWTQWPGLASPPPLLPVICPFSDKMVETEPCQVWWLICDQWKYEIFSTIKDWIVLVIFTSFCLNVKWSWDESLMNALNKES